MAQLLSKQTLHNTGEKYDPCAEPKRTMYFLAWWVSAYLQSDYSQDFGRHHGRREN